MDWDTVGGTGRHPSSVAEYGAMGIRKRTGSTDRLGGQLSTHYLSAGLPGGLWQQGAD